MAMDRREMIAFGKALERVTSEIPEILDDIVVGEGMNARDNARKLCTERKVNNEGTLRRNFKSGTKAIRSGRDHKIDVYNNLDYASHVEYGFRKHYVPGHYLSGHWRTDYPNGLVVGAKKGFVPGKYILKDAVDTTRRSQQARVRRKLDEEIEKRMRKYTK